MMGMGLAFCHKMLEKMGSKLELSSTRNIGSTFTFKIVTKYKPELEEPNSAFQLGPTARNTGCAVPMPVSKEQKSRVTNESMMNSFAHKSTMKSKRSSSLFNNEKFANLKIETGRNKLRPIDENLEQALIPSGRNGKSSTITSPIGPDNKLAPMRLTKIKNSRDQFKNLCLNSPTWYNKNILNCEQSLKKYSMNRDSALQSSFVENLPSFNIPDNLHDEGVSKKNQVPTFLNSVREGRK